MSEKNGHVNVCKVNKQKEFSCFCCTGNHSAKVCPFIKNIVKTNDTLKKVCQKKAAEENVQAHSSLIWQ